MWCLKKQNKNIRFSYLVPFGLQIFIYLNTAWRRIAADIKVKVKRARRL